MSRETIRANPQAYAYRYSNVAYEHNIKSRTEGEVISILKLSSRPLNKEANVTIPSLASTEQERDLQNGMQALLIGVLPFSYRPTNDPSKKRRASSVKNAESIEVAPRDSKVIRVVASLARDMVKYHGLVNPKDGLCEGLVIPADDIFWFHEFRDDNATSIQERKNVATAAIRKILGPIANVGEEKPTINQQQPATPIKIPWEINLANELKALVATYALCDQPWILEIIKEVLESADTDLAHGGIAMENSAIETCLNVRKPFTGEQLKQFKREVETAWPDIKPLAITEEEIAMIGSGLREEGLLLEYRLIRAFLVDILRSLRASSFLNVGELCRETRDHVLLQLGPTTPSNASVSNDPFKAFIASNGYQIKELIEYGKRYEVALRNSMAGQITGASIEEIWEQFAKTPDIEAARAMALQFHRYNTRELHQRDNSIMEKLEGLANFWAALEDDLD